MIYKITNIRLRSGRTLNRGFIIESDKMLSRNKIATLIKERTNFTPVDFSSKIHRSLLESQEDVDSALAAGEAQQKANEEINAGIKYRREELNKLTKIKKEIESIKDEIDILNAQKEQEEKNIQPLKTASDEKLQAFNRAKKEFETAHAAYEEASDEKIQPLKNKVRQLKIAIDKKLPTFCWDEDALDDKIEALKLKMTKNGQEETEIKDNEGVNLARVEKYFDTKREHLNAIIKKFRNLVKMTTNKKTNEKTVVYNELNTMLNKFSEQFDEIKTEVIEQYKSTEETPKE